ncbi:MAG: BrnT family toxin [Methylococcales bacterium]|nr:BrnT family toxin [Methylococcales bacterium]
MKIIYDAVKDTVNIDKHGVSLNDANLLEWDTLWTLADTRYDYGEDRQIGYAYIGLRLHCVIYTDRNESRRIISLRKANNREINQYAKA